MTFKKIAVTTAAVAALLLLTGTAAAQEYTISVWTYPHFDESVVTGGGKYNHGETVILTATPPVGYQDVVWWSEGDSFQDGGTLKWQQATYTFTAESNRLLFANFFRKQYTITASANPAGGGSFLYNDQHGGTSHVYNHGAQLVLKAEPTVGYELVNWTEGGTIVGTDTYFPSSTVTANRTVVANFALKEYAFTVEASPSNCGTVTGGGKYKMGDLIELTASPADGCEFVKWRTSGSSQSISTNATYTFNFNNPATYTSYVAEFVRKTYAISASANPSAGGSVTGGGTHNHGASVTLTASPAAGYDFVNWTEGGTAVSTSASYQFTAIGARTLVANFVSNTYSVEFSAGDNGTLTATVDGEPVTSPATVAPGKSVVFTASPSDGYKVLDWKLNDVAVVGQGTTFTLPSVSVAAVVSVSFDKTSSIVSNDRVIPATPNQDAAVIAPINVTAFEITVGQNPVRGSDGVVNIFVTGKRIDDGALIVYDATGNVVSKINVRDNAVLGNNGRRVIGSWDLKDGKGKVVSEGAYLLRGSVKTVDGKRERVSVVVGVR